jgi:hypothetical protein
VIWAFVSYAQTNQIAINRDFNISLIRVVFLLFADFGLLLLCFIFLRVLRTNGSTASGDSDQLPGALSPRARWINGGFLVLTIILVFLPFALMKSSTSPTAATASRLPAKDPYRVVVPYSDESIARQIGPKKWGTRLLAEVYEVVALSPDEAKAAALKQLADSDRIWQLNWKGGQRPRVEVHEKLLPLRSYARAAKRLDGLSLACVGACRPAWPGPS